MKKHLRCLSLLFLCALLLLSCTFVIYFPYHHHCTQEKCTVCALIEHADTLLAFLLLSATVWQFNGSSRPCRKSIRASLYRPSASPVRLKVKLSN